MIVVRKKFKREELLRFCIDTARAILYLHNADIVHRDIKTLNVLLDNKNTVKLCDFGLAKHIVKIFSPFISYLNLE